MAEQAILSIIGETPTRNINFILYKIRVFIIIIQRLIQREVQEKETTNLLSNVERKRWRIIDIKNPGKSSLRLD